MTQNPLRHVLSRSVCPPHLLYDVVRKLGRYTQVGLFGAPFQIDLDKVILNQLHFQGSICHSWQTWDTTLRLLADGVFDLRALISNRLPLSHWEEAF